MATESSSPTIPTEISETIGKLQSDVENVQRELGQALEVWQTTLTAEKNQFEELLKHKELAWQEQENQWARQSQAYEERIDLLKSEFKTRMDQSEQNAAHALAELDDSWQRDKLEWGPASLDPKPAQRQEWEEKIQALERQLAEKNSLPHPVAGPTPETVKALENQLVQFQQTVASFQDRAARSDELVNACVQALDYQISVLSDLVHHYTDEAAPAQPSSSPGLVD